MIVVFTEEEQNLIQELRKVEFYSYFPGSYRRYAWCEESSLDESLALLRRAYYGQYLQITAVREEIRAVVRDIDTLMEEFGWDHERYRSEVSANERPREEIERELLLPIYERLKDKHDLSGILERI